MTRSDSGIYLHDTTLRPEHHASESCEPRRGFEHGFCMSDSCVAEIYVMRLLSVSGTRPIYLECQRKQCFSFNIVGVPFSSVSLRLLQRLGNCKSDQGHDEMLFLGSLIQYDLLSESDLLGQFGRIPL